MFDDGGGGDGAAAAWSEGGNSLISAKHSEMRNEWRPNIPTQSERCKTLPDGCRKLLQSLHITAFKPFSEAPQLASPAACFFGGFIYLFVPLFHQDKL